MRRLTAALVFLSVLCSCSADVRDDTAAPDRTLLFPPGQVELAAALTSFESCEPFLQHVKANALEMVGPWGLDMGYAIAVMESSDMMRDGTQATADSSKAGLDPGVDYSTTNVQEAGVDEPDILKTDGRRIVALANEELHVIDVTGVQPRSLGRLRFEKFWPQEMLLAGDRILVFGQSHSNMKPVPRNALPTPGWSTPISTLVEIDIGTSKPRIIHRLNLDGSYLSSRMVDDVVRSVVRFVFRIRVFSTRTALSLRQNFFGLEHFTLFGTEIKGEKVLVIFLVHLSTKYDLILWFGCQQRWNEDCC